MKKIIVPALVVMGLLFAGLACAAPLGVAGSSDLVVSGSSMSGDSGVPAQLAQYYGHRCHCCWRTYRGYVKCRWMSVWKCRDRGGWCRW